MKPTPAETKPGKKMKPGSKPFSEETFFKRLRLKNHGDLFNCMSKLSRLSAQGRLGVERYRALMTGLSLMSSALDRSIDEAKKNSARTFHGHPIGNIVAGGNDDELEPDDTDDEK